MVLIPAFLGIRLESGGLLGHHQPHYWPALANRLQERDPMSKLTDNLDANFQLFIEEVRESGQVWGLRYGEDWVVCRSAEFEDADVMPLWSAEAPVGNGQTEKSTAKITVYYPEKPNGTAIVICPGGGYGGLAIDPEGHGIAKWLNKQGITGVVLEYRLPAGRSQVPLLDAQRAIRLTRAR